MTRRTGRAQFILVIVFLILNALLIHVSALKIYPVVKFEVENEIYAINQVMVFSKITISDSYIVFNNTGFYIDSPNYITISLQFINSNIGQANNGDLVLQFSANTNSGNVLFDISGFPPGNEYKVERDGNPISYPIADSSGIISFSNSLWSNREFSIYQIDSGSDTISPEISDIVISNSNPKDTESGFGWENITCDITDNVEVDEVKVNIIYPDNSISDVTMIRLTGTDTYYYNTSFSQYGSYNYYIWAQDTSANENTSGSNLFSLPPNWDVDSDGQCKVIDLILVSNNYYDTGKPGWIREDVDNNGVINVLDLVLITNNYGEKWS
jgi:hypothetical protein